MSLISLIKSIKGKKVIKEFPKEKEETWGTPFLLIFKSSTKKKTVTTEAMDMDGKVIVKTTTSVRNISGDYSISEGLTTLEGAEIMTVYLKNNKEKVVRNNDMPEGAVATRRYINKK
jgi:hypothetical protein